MVLSITIINALIFHVFSVHEKKKKNKPNTTVLSFSLRSNIKAHIRLQSHLNFWTAGFIILLFRKRSWFYRIDSNSWACPDVLREPWCAQADEESAEFMRTQPQSGSGNLSLCHQRFSNSIEMSLGAQYTLPEMELVNSWGFLNIFSALFHCSSVSVYHCSRISVLLRMRAVSVLLCVDGVVCPTVTWMKLFLA